MLGDFSTIYLLLSECNRLLKFNRIIYILKVSYNTDHLVGLGKGHGCNEFEDSSKVHMH